MAKLKIPITSTSVDDQIGVELDTGSPKPVVKFQRALDFASFSERAFPYCCNSPADIEQFLSFSFVASHIGIEFCLPEFTASRRSIGIGTSRVTMPEAAVDQADRSVAWENDVRFAWQFLVVQAVSEPASMKGAPQHDLRACVLAANPRHHAGPCCLVHYIRHQL